MAVTIKTKEEIGLIREGGKRLAGILNKVVEAARPGIATAELDLLAEDLIIKSGGNPSFKGYRIKGVDRGYPATMCISINDEVVHGIPRKDRILKEGDIVGLDIGMWWPFAGGAQASNTDAGYEANKMLYSQSSEGARSNIMPSLRPLCTDMAVTIGMGKISKEARGLIDATRESLEIGIAEVRPGATIGDIGNAIERFLKKYKLGIVRDLAGHGVGYELHEEPLIPNYGKAGKGMELKEGMVIAIEPMATLGDWRVILSEDQWTFKTIDKSLGAHFEHTMAVTKDGVEVLTR
ncbi:MAG: M24 family metallopeptidase [bacterium]|nr:M24 family metallopeptidase [bacterium]MDZ4286278.1 M24 family metallopeptidase [Candidatus Sungbacteria bacterium]